MLFKTIKWPLIGAFIGGAFHFTEVAIWPEMQSAYTSAVLGLVQFAFGSVTGYMAVRNGGNFLTAGLYGAALGFFPLVVTPLTFGLMLGQDMRAAVLGGVFGFSMMVYGALVGGALGVSLNESRK